MLFLIIQILIPLAVINYYLMLRKRDQLSLTQKVMISLMSIGLLFTLLVFGTPLLHAHLIRMYGGTFYLSLIFINFLLLPILITETVLAAYFYFGFHKRK